MIALPSCRTWLTERHHVTQYCGQCGEHVTGQFPRLFDVLTGQPRVHVASPFAEPPGWATFKTACDSVAEYVKVPRDTGESAAGAVRCEAGRTPPRPLALAAAGTTDLRGNVVKLRGSLRPDRRNGRQADDDDQSQHHGILDSCWAIFGLEESLHLRREILHFILPTYVAL